MKTKVNVDEILRLMLKRMDFNRLKLEDIEWTNDEGKTIEVDSRTIREFKFTGLNNTDFVEMVIFGDFEKEHSPLPRRN